MPKNFISNKELRKLLEQATEEEKLALTKLIKEKKKSAYSAKKLQIKICELGGLDFVNYIREGGTGYLDILDGLLDKLDIEGFQEYDEIEKFDRIVSPYNSLSIPLINFDSPLEYKKSEAKKLGLDYAEKVEEKIILKLLEDAYENMSQEKRKNFDEQISLAATKFGSSNNKELLTGTAGLLALGNLGGFATYTFLTSLMSTVSFGTLGFGAYTAATSLLSVLLGPVGWAGLGVFAAYSYSSPEYKKLIPIVATIGAIRQRVKYESQFTEKKI